jgi:hypothetical protein
MFTFLYALVRPLSLQSFLEYECHSQELPLRANPFLSLPLPPFPPVLRIFSAKSHN